MRANLRSPGFVRSVAILTFCLAPFGMLWIGCGGAQESDTTPTTDEGEEASSPPPRAEPQVWDAESSYQIGWPIDLRVGIVNTGQTVVKAPPGASYGVKIKARRADIQPPAAPEAEEGGEAGDAGAEAAGDGGAEAAAEPQAEPIECDSIPRAMPSSDLLPLATASNTNRMVHLDRLCNFTRPGRYFVELIVDVPPEEGSSVANELEPVTIEFEVTMPDPPLVARLSVAEESYEVGQPVEATLRVTNYGEEPVRFAGAGQLKVMLRAEANGETVPCTEPGRGRGRPGNLAPGESRETAVVLSERCQLSTAGTYTITTQVEVPSAGRRSFAGTLDAAPVTVELLPGAEPESEDEADPDAAEEEAIE